MARVLAAALVAEWAVPSASVPMASLHTFPVYSHTGYNGGWGCFGVAYVDALAYEQNAHSHSVVWSVAQGS